MRQSALALVVIVLLVGCTVFSIANVCAESGLDETIFSNDTWSTVTPTETPVPDTPTPRPTPIPTPKIVPGSPLTLGSSTLAETLAQLDIINVAKLVVIALCIMWVVIILASVDKKFAKE